MGLCVLLLTSCKEKSLENAYKAAFDTPQYTWKSGLEETVLIWSRDHEWDRIYMQRAFQRYTELTGNQVKIVSFPQVEFEQAVKQAFEGKGEKPDILLSYGGTNIEAFDPDENFYDFREAVWVHDLTVQSINQTIYNGKVIGLPHWEASISGTIYNKKIFEKLDLQVPKNQEEFLVVCQTLKENGIIPVYLPYKEISTLLYQFPMDSIVEDSSVLTELNDGSISYADLPEMAAIVEWYRTMSESGYFGEEYLENDWNGMDDALKSGSYGMMLAWDTWLYTDFTGEAADFGLMPAFMGVPEQGTFEGPNLGLLIVNKKSERLEAALNMITFLADPYNYNVAFEGIYTAPVFKNQAASISTPQYVEAERLIERNFRDSIAWLRIRGFSQMDAVCIQKYMQKEPGYTIRDCLMEMDQKRENRKKEGS